MNSYVIGVQVSFLIFSTIMHIVGLPICYNRQSIYNIKCNNKPLDHCDVFFLVAMISTKHRDSRNCNIMQLLL